MWIDETPTATDAKLIAGRDIAIQGSDLSVTPAIAESILIDNDGASSQILAGRDISLTGKVISGAGITPTASADIIINGVQTSAAGSISVDSADRILLFTDQNAGTDIDFLDGVLLTGQLTLAVGRDLEFASTLDDDGSLGSSSNLTITATRDVAFYGNVGAASRLESLTISSASGVLFGDADGGSPRTAAIGASEPQATSTLARRA